MSEAKKPAGEVSVRLEVENHVAVVTIDRPRAMNALSVATLDELEAVLDRIEADPDVRAVVLTGAGEKAFVAGADITEIKDLDRQGGEAFARRGQALFARIEAFARPVIAAVNGYALGGGCELAMACDIRVASANARFGQPEVNLGLLPGYGGTQRLPRLVGLGRAKLLMLTGDMVDAEQAYKLGLVDRLVPENSALKESLDLARAIAGKPPLAVGAIKRSANASDNGEAGYGVEALAFGDIMETEDKAEGIGAFLEKRAADWKGR
jgi:enoyl-CoA hydratase